MGTIKLSRRLQSIASLVPLNSSVADIGTDHGYIPVWLAQKGQYGKLAACDIHKGPLEHAKQTAAVYEVVDQIQFELCNGLSFTNSSDYQTVIIAGMGGEMIASILEAAPWTKNGTLLILQPNSRISVLIQWLQESGYQVLDAVLCKEAGKYYQILVVRSGKEPCLANETDRLIHPKYFEKRDPLLNEYISHLITRYETAERGMLTSKQASSELKHTQEIIHGLKHKLEENRHANR